MISKKYAKANNPYLNHYDSRQPTHYLMYLDANNMYRWDMSQSLPTHDFCWLTLEEMKTIDVHASLLKMTGFIFEVDLKYAVELHEYPLAPESFQIKPDFFKRCSLLIKKSCWPSLG